MDTTFTKSVFHNLKLCCSVEKDSFNLKVLKMYFVFFKVRYKTFCPHSCNVLYLSCKKNQSTYDFWSHLLQPWSEITLLCLLRIAYPIMCRDALWPAFSADGHFGRLPISMVAEQRLAGHMARTVEFITSPPLCRLPCDVLELAYTLL